MKLLRQFHEWLADRVSFIQYPGVKRVSPKPKWRPYESSPFIKVEDGSQRARLTWSAQIALFFYSIILLGVALLFLAVGGVAVWAVLSSFF